MKPNIAQCYGEAQAPRLAHINVQNHYDGHDASCHASMTCYLNTMQLDCRLIA